MFPLPAWWVAFWQQVLQYPLIVQGALGSALCVAALAVGKGLYKLASAVVSRYSYRAKVSRLTQEWIYRKYTSSSGLVPFTQGSLLSLMKSQKYLCLAATNFVVGIMLREVWMASFVISSCISIYYLNKALSWMDTGYTMVKPQVVV